MSVTRRLASIQKIWKIDPIEGADRIELAHVLGWQCVVNKVQFQPGDMGVYFQIDSFLPIREEFEFMRATSYKKSELFGEGFRIRTMNFRGQISQGLILPLSAFPEIGEAAEHEDVTELLNVKKWEVPERVNSSGTIIGDIPSFMPKTDEIRIQEYPELINEFGDAEYYITMKMDGTSCSVGIDASEEGDGALHVAGRNYEYKDDDKSAFYKHVKGLGLEERMRKLMDGEGLKALVLQGEFCGEGIQKNRLKLRKPEWYVFTVRADGKRVDLDALQRYCEALGLTMVPLEERDRGLASKYPDVDALLARAAGSYPNGGPKEGIVIRPVSPVYSETLRGPLSFKVINNKFLLKHEE